MTKKNTLALLLLCLFAGSLFAMGEQPKNEPTKQPAPVVLKLTGKHLAGNLSPLVTYNIQDFKTTLASDKFVMLLFVSNNCKVCKAEDTTLRQAFDAILTDKLVGFRVNFDQTASNDEKELAKLIGVTKDHTKIVMRKGQILVRSAEGWNPQRYVTQINQIIATP
ncbi:MAG: hypothetical protein WC405_20010 [Syntrophales bacterium]